MNCNKKSHFDSVTPVHRHGREGGALGGGAGLGGEGVGEGWGGAGWGFTVCREEGLSLPLRKRCGKLQR